MSVLEWLFGPRTPAAFIAGAQKIDPPPPRSPGGVGDFGKYHYWKLEHRLPADVQRLFQDGTVAIGEIGKLIPDAKTYPVNKGYAILFYAGMSRFLYCVSRALHTRVNVHDKGGPVIPASTHVQRTVDIVAEVFHNYMENHKIAGPRNYPLTPEQIKTASLLANYAESFFVAHEIAHAVIGCKGDGNVNALSPQEEIEADRLALTYVLGLNGEADGMHGISPRMAYAGAEFGLRVLAGLAQVGYQFQESHPPPDRRLLKIRELAMELCGGYREYIRISTIAFSYDQLLEEVVERLLGAKEPGSLVIPTTDRIVSTLSVLVEEYEKGHMTLPDAVVEIVTLFAGAPAELAHKAAQEAVVMYIREPTRLSAAPDKIGAALSDLAHFHELIEALPEPPRQLFVRR